MQLAVGLHHRLPRPAFERDLLAFADGLHSDHIFNVLPIAGVVLDPRIRERKKVRHICVEIPAFRVVGREDAGERQRVRQLVFADVERIKERRQRNVRRDSLDLRRASVNAVEPRRRDLHRPVFLGTHPQDSLNRPLAMRTTVAENDGSPDVLQVPRHDFRCACARTIRQDDHRQAEGGRIARRNRQTPDRPLVADLHDRPGGNEERREHHRLPKRTAPVAAQVENQPLHVLRIEIGEIAADVHRATPIPLLIGTLVHRAVESRQVDVAEFPVDAIEADGLDAPRRRLILQLDFVPRQFDEFLRRARRIASRQNLKRDLRPLLSANLLDGLLHRLPGDVLELAVRLPHADNLVALLDASVAVNRPAGHDLHDLQRPVVHRQHRPDPAERQVHVHVEVLLRRGAHVVRMGVVGTRNRAQVVLKHGLLVRLGQDGRILPVALDERLLGCQNLFRHGVRLGGLGLRLDGLGPIGLCLGLLRVDLPVEHLHENFVLHPLAPVLVRILNRLRPGRVLPADAVGLVRREVPFAARKKVGREIDALAQTLHVEIVDLEAELDVPVAQLVVQRLFVRGEGVEVALEEDRVVIVVERDEIRPGTLGDFVVQGLLQHVVARQHGGKAFGDLAVVFLRSDRHPVGGRRLDFRKPRKRGQRKNERQFQLYLHELLSIRWTRRSNSAGGSTLRPPSKLFFSSHELMTTAPCNSAAWAAKVSLANVRTGVTAPVHPRDANAARTCSASRTACESGEREGSCPSRRMCPSSIVTTPFQNFVSMAKTPAGPTTT